MDITYLGHASFRLKGKNATLVTDPFESSAVGLKFPKHTACDIVTVSHGHPDHNAISQLEGNPFVIDGPGEYEIKGVGIIGIGSYHDAQKGAERGKNTIYHIDIDGVRIVHLGDLGHTLSSAEVDALGEVDVLLVPVGGVYTITAAEAAQVVNDIEPDITIPMHFNTPEHDPKTFKDLEPVHAFLKIMGKEGLEPAAKVSVTKDKLPEERQVIVLS